MTKRNFYYAATLVVLLVFFVVPATTHGDTLTIDSFGYCYGPNKEIIHGEALILID